MNIFVAVDRYSYTMWFSEKHCRPFSIFLWCCYKPVDPETHTLQNGFSTYKLTFIRKPIFNEKITKKHEIFFIAFIFHYIKFFGIYKHFLVMQPLQNPPLCSSTVFRTTQGDWWPPASYVVSR
jgi:hypothetical protein